MLTRPLGFFLCLVLCVGCLLGLYRLQAQPQPQEVPPTPQERPQPPPETEGVSEPPRPLFSESIDSDFYQTIIRNNLFAPLGTVLNQTPVLGANLKLIATFTRDDPSKASAIVENTATGKQQRVFIGTVVSGYQVLDIQAKQILIEKDGSPPIWKRIETFFLLNTRGR